MKEISEKIRRWNFKSSSIKRNCRRTTIKKSKTSFTIKASYFKKCRIIRELEKRDRDINLLNKKIEYYQKRLKQREEEEEKEKMDENNSKKNENKDNEYEQKFKEIIGKRIMDYEEFKIKDFSKLSSINNLQKDKNTIDNDNDTLENISQFFNEKKETAKFEVKKW